MDFVGELELLLPSELPNRARVATVAARHLQLIEGVNEHMNLTRISGAREAVIKHVVDSLLPWKLFEGAATVMDAGTGAGFPGIPLSAVFPATKFLLVDSTQKKARFVESAVSEMGLDNVEVSPERAEDALRKNRVELITARAVAPLERALAYFALGLKQGARALLYKGPDVDAELRAAEPEARRKQVSMKVVMKYELPDALGTRAIVQIRRVSGGLQ